MFSPRFSRIRGQRRYELSNHLGNVMAVVSDRKVIKAVGRDTLYFADLVSATDYYAFGMVMADRSWNTEGYRYGFNGKENDNEVGSIMISSCEKKSERLKYE